MSTRVSASRLRVPTPVLDTDAANKAYADSKLTKLAVGQNTQIYARNGAGVDTGIGYSGNPLANTIPIRDAGGRIAVEDPTAIGHAATKNYVDTTTPKIADGAVISGPNNLSGALGTWAPESSGFIHLPHLFNDLAYNIIRGGAITITQNGNPIASANIPKVFEPNTTALSIALVDKATDVFVVEVDTCVAFRYGTQVGIAMPSGFRGKNVVIEGWYNDVWNPITTRSSVETGLVIQAISVPTSATTPMTRLRYTIRDFHSSASFRISSIFAMAYNSPLLEQGFVSRAGGDLYGPLYTPADPTRADELVRKAYADTKVNQTALGNRVYGTNSSGTDAPVQFSSAPTPATLVYRSTDGVTSVGEPVADTHATTKLYVDTQLLGKVNNNDSRLSDARTPTAHSHAWSEVTGKPTVFPPEIGSTATTAVAGNDARLTNARTPTAHTHTVSELSDASTVAKTALVAADAATFRSAIGAGTGNSNLAIGTTSTTAKAGDYQPTWAQVTGKPTTFAPIIGSGAADAVAGNDARLTNARTPTAHTHLWADITDKPTTFAPIIGSTATTAVAGNDARLTDARVPLDNSVTNVKIPVGAAIDPTKLGTGRVIAVDGADAPISIITKYLSQAQYDALGTKDPNTEYNII